MMLNPQRLGALPASYEDCHALMCQAFQGYQPTDEENWACSQLRGSFEGRSFSPLDCYAPSTPTLPDVAPITPEVMQSPETVDLIVAATPITPTAAVKFSPIRILPNSSTEMPFGWRIRPCAQQCGSPTWWYLLLGAAVLAGMSRTETR